MATPRRTLPPLNALRAFEAFGRHGRMTTAADELFVTHGAVSRQIRQLEQWLGYPLTEGPKTQLRLTADARRLLEAASAAFDLIGQAAGPATRAETDLRIGCHGTFAIRWLIPRLADFAARHPDLHVHVQEMNSPVDADTISGLDGAIDLRTSAPAGLTLTPFSANFHGPVMSPGRWAALGGNPERLMAEPRLHARTWPRGWSNWAKARKIQLPPAAERHFDHFSHALEAAAAGLGVALASWAFCVDDVTSGRLVAPLGFVREPGGVALVRPASRQNPALDRFADWLVEQGQRMPAPPRPSRG
jgi:LysR family transcriptional regulator, glycine cleavage system transcriptional activator